MKYDVVVLQTENGLNVNSFKALLDMVDGEEIIPIDLEAHNVECTAIGVISTKAAEKLEYDYEALRDYLSMIMEDVEKESPDNQYSFHTRISSIPEFLRIEYHDVDLSVYMGYERDFLKDMEDEKEM